jgi:hypothetical protein
MVTPARAPSPQQRDQLYSLTEWLRTFEGFDESGCSDGLEILQSRNAVR